MADGYNSLKETQIPPRGSVEAAGPAATSMQDTPWRTLNRLANMPQTPSRRALSAGPASAYKSSHRTPGGVGQRLGSAKQAVMLTPHGRAAQRELNSRRVGLTPGQDRRRSGRQQRETPRDALRALSKLMAPDSQIIASTPQGSGDLTPKRPFRVHDDLDNEPDPELPRFSLPFGDDDGEDDSLLLPPPSSKLEDENFTVRSVELGRRAQSERPQSRISRGSFGSLRMSGGIADPNDIEYEDLRDAYDSSILAGHELQDDTGMFFGDYDDPVVGENTRTSSGVEQGRFPLGTGQIGGIQPANMQQDDTETTFVFNVPELQSLDGQQVPRGNARRSALDEVDADENENDESTKQGTELNPASRQMRDLGGELLFHDPKFQGIDVTSVARRMAKKRRTKLSRYGIEYPSLPPSLVRRMATSFARSAGNSKSKLSKDALDAVILASDWFFEQIGDDLGVFAMHAGRKTIDESDISTLMSRQRQTSTTTTPFSLAQRYLPRELLQELRMDSRSKNSK